MATGFKVQQYGGSGNASGLYSLPYGFNPGYNDWFNAGIYALNKHLVFGRNGKFAYSSDAIGWAVSSSLRDSSWGISEIYSVATNGTTVVVGGASGKIATSTDGINFAYQSGLASTTFGTNAVLGIAYGSSKFVAVGVGGVCATSTDGITWTYQSSLPTALSSSNARCITWTGTKFVVGGASGKIATSTDGVTWTYQSGLASTTFSTNDVTAIGWNGTTLFAVGTGSVGASSTDGETWTYQSGFYSAVGQSRTAVGICWSGTAWCCPFNGFGVVITSTDGVTWTLRSTPYGANSLNMCYSANNKFYISGYASNIIYSTDATGSSWSVSQLGWQSPVGFDTGAKIKYQNGTYYAYGGALATSTNASSWTQIPQVVSALNSGVVDINWNGSRYVAVGSGVATSTDLVTWTKQSTLGGMSAKGVIWNGSIYVAVGILSGDPLIYTSPDGVTWTSRTVPGWTPNYSNNNDISISWNGSQFLIIVATGYSATSPDGVTWTKRTGLSSTLSLSSLYIIPHIWTGTKYIVAAGAKLCATSTDGITWTAQSGLSSTAGSQTVSSLIMADNKIVVMDSTPKIAVSEDGLSWNVYTLNIGGSGMGWDGNQLLVSGTTNSVMFASIDYKVDLDDLLVRRDAFASGNMFGFGNNGQGQLGDGTTTSRSSPVTTAGGGTNWKQVSLALKVTGGIKTDGSLWLWGDGTTSPTSVPGGGNNWKQVSAGGGNGAADWYDYPYYCGLKTDGSLWSSGNNNSGQLGDGTTSNRTSPVSVIGGTNWKQVSCGGKSTAAIKTDGTLWSWGDNSNGQLGDGTTSNRSSPVQVFGGGTWKYVSLGNMYTLAIKTDGSLWSWGSNYYGELGIGSSSFGTYKTSPQSVLGGGYNWKTCGAGALSSGIKTDNSLWFWGYAVGGFLSNSPITAYGNSKDWKQMSNGRARLNICGLKTDGTVWMFPGEYSNPDSTSPVSISGGITTWRQISQDYNTVIGVTDLTI